MQSTAQLPVIGMDIAKNVFQLHIVDAETGEIQRRQLKRAKVAEFFSNRQPSLVAIEACGGAHHWARTLQGMGHQVKLLPAKHVRAFVLRDKTDALDAQAIWVAAQQPHIREVPVKSEQQQACLSLHRIRAQLMKMRIMQTNALRGLLYEFGMVLPEGHKKLLQSIQGELAKAQQDNRLCDVVVLSVQEQLKRIDAMQDDIDRLDKRLAAMVRQNQHMLAVQAIPGIGPLTATALIATVADVSTFKSGRQFAAWLGLTPRQVGTGGKTQQLGISKRGDTYLRSLLVNGARAVVGRSAHNSWLERLLQRRHFNVVVAALANKMARTAWAVLAKGKAFDSLKWNPTEAAAT
ncbi:IS110 family RNA-guided transposase [Polaromonas glacialis]|uniref:IS110 family transposase n=1 Tax=Polaromonas glacialis TaxID=866564 RepID=UPI0004976F81|nr:IS110 family transposase [Polaromonas glacialis]